MGDMGSRPGRHLAGGGSKKNKFFFFFFFFFLLPPPAVRHYCVGNVLMLAARVPNQHMSSWIKKDLSHQVPSLVKRGKKKRRNKQKIKVCSYVFEYNIMHVIK